MDELKNQFTDFLDNITDEALSIKKLMQMIKLYAQLRRGNLYYYPPFKCFFYAYSGHYLLMEDSGESNGELFNENLYKKMEKNAITLPLVAKALSRNDLYIVARDFCKEYMISYIDDTSMHDFKSQKKQLLKDVEDDPALLQCYQSGKQDGGETGYMLAVKDIFAFLDERHVLEPFVLSRLHEEFISHMHKIDYNKDTEELFFEDESDLSVMYNYIAPYLESGENGEEILRSDAPDIVRKTKDIYDHLLDLKARKRVS
jgi:hypothetical protein